MTASLWLYLGCLFQILLRRFHTLLCNYFELSFDYIDTCLTMRNNVKTIFLSVSFRSFLGIQWWTANCVSLDSIWYPWQCMPDNKPWSSFVFCEPFAIHFCVHLCNKRTDHVSCVKLPDRCRLFPCRSLGLFQNIWARGQFKVVPRTICKIFFIFKRSFPPFFLFLRLAEGT